MKRVMVCLMAIMLLGLGSLSSQPIKNMTVGCSEISVDGANIGTTSDSSIYMWAYSNDIVIDIDSSCAQNLTFFIDNLSTDNLVIEGLDEYEEISSTKISFTIDVSMESHLRLYNDTEGIDSFTFIAMGDNRDGPETFMAILDEIDNYQFAFSINTGDLVPSGRLEQFVEFMEMIGDLTYPFYTAMGNHELNNNSVDLAASFLGEPNYSFDYGNTHFIILDNSLYYITEEQYEWMRADINGTSKTNIVLSCHVPPYDPREGESHSMAPEGAQEFMDFNEEMGVDLVLNGHIHMYDTKTLQGVEYIITGGAGAPLYASEPEGGFFHYIVCTVEGDEISSEVVKVISPLYTPEIALEQLERSEELYDTTSNSLAESLELVAELESSGKDLTGQKKILSSVEDNLATSYERIIESKQDFDNEYWRDSIIDSKVAYSYSQQASVNLENINSYLETLSADEGFNMMYVGIAFVAVVLVLAAIVFSKKRS